MKRADQNEEQPVDVGIGQEERAGTVFVPRTQEVLVAGEELLTVSNVSKVFSRTRRFRKVSMTAVDDVSLSLSLGRVTALVGQRGSGKSTIAKMITGIERPTSGTIAFGGIRVDRLRGRALKDCRRNIQMVFQDPFSSLNTALTVAYILGRPLRNYLGLSGKAQRNRILELLESVGLTPVERYTGMLPLQMSGGQRQRVVIARALAPEPKILVADEPISMLDVSIRAELLQLLDGIVQDRHIAMLYITHDLLSARLIADDMLVLNKGRVVERGPVREVTRKPAHDYTRLLLDSIPRPYAETDLTADLRETDDRPETGWPSVRRPMEWRCEDRSVDAVDVVDPDRGREALGLEGRSVNGLHDIHAGGDLAEGGEALTVRVAAPAEVEFGLGAQAVEEVRERRIGQEAGHRERAVVVTEAGQGGAFELDRVEPVTRLVRSAAALDDLDQDVGIGLVVEPDDAVEQPAVVEAGVHVAEEVRRRDRRGAGEDVERDRAEFRIDDDRDDKGPARGVDVNHVARRLPIRARFRIWPAADGPPPLEERL